MGPRAADASSGRAGSASARPTFYRPVGPPVADESGASPVLPTPEECRNGAGLQDVRTASGARLDADRVADPLTGA